MQGLAQLQHHIVRHIDHIVDRAHAGGLQPFHQPAGRRADRHARRSPAPSVACRDRVPRSAPTASVRGGVARLHADRPQGGQRSAGDRRDLAGDPEDAQAVRAVRRDLQCRAPSRRAGRRAAAPTTLAAASVAQHARSRIRMPQWSSERPELAHRSRPSPRSGCRAASCPPAGASWPGRRLPTPMNGTSAPTKRFWAPVTTVCSRSPRSRVASQSLSALGWRSRPATRATRISSQVLAGVLHTLHQRAAHRQPLGKLARRQRHGHIVPQPGHGALSSSDLLRRTGAGSADRWRSAGGYR